MHPYVHSSTIHNSQNMETTQASVNRWMDKEDVVHIYIEILLSHEKEQNNAICSNLDTTTDYQTKWSKSERERQIPYNIIYMWNLKYGTNWLIYKQKQTLRHRDKTCGCQGEGREMDWEFGVGICKLLHLGLINNKVLLYSTGNYIQSPRINHNGKEYWNKECICM